MNSVGKSNGSIDKVHYCTEHFCGAVFGPTCITATNNF